MGRPPSSFLYSSTAQLRENSKLTDYPLQVQTYGRKIAVVGIATRGCRIAYALSLQCRQLDNFLYLSCDEEDVLNIPISSGKKIVFETSNSLDRNPANVRGVVTPQLEQVRKELFGSQLVFVVSGLGGMIGSGIAPLVAKSAKQVHAMVVGIVVLPLAFEKHKYFFAGCALRQLTENCDGVIQLENEMMLSSDEMSLVDADASLYEKLSLAINTLINPIETDGSGTGVERVVDYIRANPYSVLRVTAEEIDIPEIISEASNSSGVLLNCQSREDVDRIINSYDPVDACLRRSKFDNLDPDFDSSLEIGQRILRNIES